MFYLKVVINRTLKRTIFLGCWKLFLKKKFFFLQEIKLAMKILQQAGSNGDISPSLRIVAVALSGKFDKFNKKRTNPVGIQKPDIWKPDVLCQVFKCHLNTGPFGMWTTFDHSKSGRVWIWIPTVICCRIIYHFFGLGKCLENKTYDLNDLFKKEFTVQIHGYISTY